MLLFNAMGIFKELAAVCYFNTSLVVIQLIFSIDFLPIFCRFQYILCYYSTNLLEAEIVQKILFQYILCYYSTDRFFMILQIYAYFNTSYVIIQPTKNRHSCILLIYINNDLKPFLSCFTNHSIENQLFVRNHVFTPFDRLFQKITW